MNKKLTYSEKENYSKIKHFKTIEEMQNYGWQHLNAEVLRRYEPFIKGSVIELGCSFGYDLYTLHVININLELTGVDINAEELEKGRVFLNKAGVPVTLIAHNILDYTYEKNRYDTVLLFHILEHTYQEDVETLMLRVRDMLRPKGCVLVCMPYGPEYVCPEHVNDFNRTKLVKTMEQYNFLTIDCYMEERRHGLRHPCKLLAGVFCEKNN